MYNKYDKWFKIDIIFKRKNLKIILRNRKAY